MKGNDTKKSRSISDLQKKTRENRKETREVGQEMDRSGENLKELDEMDDSLVADIPAEQTKELEASVRKAFDSGKKEFDQFTRKHESKLREGELTRRDIEKAVKDAVSDSKKLNRASDRVQGSPLEEELSDASGDLKKQGKSLDSIAKEMSKSLTSEALRSGYDIENAKDYLKEHNERERRRRNAGRESRDQYHPSNQAARSRRSFLETYNYHKPDKKK